MKTMKARLAGVAALLGVAAIAAGCGSTNSTTSSQNAAAASTTSAGSSAAASTTGGAAVKTATGSQGTYIAGAGGRALYLWEADRGSKSQCTGGCAQAWPPLLTKGNPVASGAVKGSGLGTTTRSDGSRQVTYHGHPLYYFAGDTAAGMTNGQGSDAFGAKWWLVTPSGTAITSSGPASSSGSSGGYSSGY